ncbi:MAG: 30S ribosomal protein S1 [Armatimonadota bacterium]|nr:30S ribosomal protein S1 [Armatimonadota bacterium]
MTDENKELEVKSGEKYGLAETPFSGYSAPKDAEEPVEAKETEEEATAEEPTVEEPTVEEPTVEEPTVEEPTVEEPVAEETSEPIAEEVSAVVEVPVEETVEASKEETPPAQVEKPEPAARPTQKEDGTSQVDYSRTFRTLTEGDVVDGVVVHIDREGVLVDVGAKSEGIIRPHELSRSAVQNPEDIVQVGDHIDVYVMRTESEDENLLLSKKRADFEQAWGRVEEAHKEGKTITAMVSDRVKGGLVVDLGIRGFVPGSHVGSGKMKNLDKFVGQSLPLKVIEVDRERRKVVLSHRQAIEEDRESMRSDTLATIKEGDIRDGVVRRMTDYGAFIDLGGIDGLLHISEMSWTRINHPSEILKVGDKIQVMVLKLNLDQGRVSLGLRQILPDPWMEVARKYRVGDIIKGKVSRLVPFGAFIQVEGGVEGIIPNAELAIRRVSKPEEVVQVGQEVEARVVDLRVEERRMTLSVRNLQQQKEREELSTYTSQKRDEQRTTVGDLVGDIMTEAARRGAFGQGKEKEVEVEEKEQEISKPKPKKRASKAERRAQEVEPDAVVDEAAAEPVADVEPEAAVEPETVAEPEAATEPEVVVEPEPVVEPESAATEEPEAPSETAEPAAEEKPAEE